MKKILLIFLLCLVSFNAFSAELWNGFTTDMSVSDFMSHSKEVLETEDILQEMKDVHFTLSHDHKNNPECNAICLFSPAPQYNQYCGANILAYFLNDKLYAVIVRWDANGKELLKKMKNQWGKPATVPITPSTYKTFYVWEESERYVYLLTEENPASTFYLDKKAKDEWVYNTENAKALAEQQEKERRKSNREKVLNSVILKCDSNEIWNGITPEMTVEDCNVYYQTELDYGRIYERESQFSFVPDNLPYADTVCLSLETEKEDYDYTIWESDLTEINTRAYYDVDTYFYNNKAIAVCIKWTIGEKDMRMLLNSKFNLPQKAKKSYSNNYYIGVVNNNDVYMYGSDRECKIYFVNKDFIETYKEEIKKKQSRSKEPNF